MDGEDGSHGLAGSRSWDIGDIVEVGGQVHTDRTGGVGLNVSCGRLLAKALQIHHGLSQKGHRARRPELALMEGTSYRERFAARARVLAAVRAWMADHEFIELETPMLQSRHGGAPARPFYTHHNALDRDLSLRISSQLHLRRCTVGDLERVFELGRCFRNEGMSPRHSPEFTMLEWSMAYSDYRDSARFVELMVSHVAKKVLGTTRVTFRGSTIDLDAPWRRISFRDAVKEHTGLDAFEALDSTTSWQSPAEPSHRSRSDAVHHLYSTEVEPHLLRPSIVFDFPHDTHPCARRHPTIDGAAECFDVVVGGLEIASGGTEISDPEEQQRRFDEQRNATSHEQLCSAELEYLTALEYGAPPSSGAGVGIDRLLMVLLGLSDILDVNLFSPTR